MAAAFEDARFESSGTVGHFAFRDLFEKLQAVFRQFFLSICRKNLCEGKPFAREKTIGNFSRAAAAMTGRFWY